MPAREKFNEPLRSCLACRSREAKAGLLRFVASGGALRWDPGQNLPGRGAYLHKRAECLARAAQSRIWIKAFKRQGHSFKASDLRPALEEAGRVVLAAV